MPLLAKPGSIVVFGSFERDFEYDYLEGANAVIYQLEDHASAEAKVYDTEANPVCEIKATREGGRVTVNYTKTDKTFTVTVGEKHAEAKAGTESLTIEL